jgi:hypothetical protein
MLEVIYEGKIAKIDVRQRILRGEHPRSEILDFVKQANPGTIIEIHLPHAAQPLVTAVESLGINPVLNKLDTDHYRLMCVKL